LPAERDGPGRRSAPDPTERLDSNWTELPQELRVIQTGVQFLTGFLLFGRHERAQEVGSAHHLAIAGMFFLALAVLLIVAPWVVYPWLLRLARRDQPGNIST
jgi:hypothetical protein